MPNHVKTVIKFKKMKQYEVVDLVNSICGRDPEDPLDYYIDFDKIIPEPRKKEDCPESCIRTEDSHVEEDAERPWYDWYKWRLRYWDTKWGAYDCHTNIKLTGVTFVFSTAWSPAIPIFTTLATKYHYDMEVMWADEDYGSNCGKMKYEQESDMITWTTPIDMKDPVKFAKRLWSEY